MAGDINKKEVIYILFLVSFVFGVFYFYQGQYFLKDMFRGSELRPVTPVAVQRSQQNQSFNKSVEASLNQLLKDVFVEVKVYRQKRKVLDEVLKPQNLRDETYITEAYQFAMQSIPDLRQRSNHIIQIFSQKDKEIKDMIKGRPPTAQENILKSWRKLKAEQVDLYVSYFAIEQEILNVYQNLATFYYQNRKNVTYVEGSKAVIFTTENLNAKASEYLQQIQVLKRKQSKL